MVHCGSTCSHDSCAFAVEEAIIALVRIYQSMTFQLADSCPEPLDLRQGITVAPKGGIPVKVMLRDVA